MITIDTNVLIYLWDNDAPGKMAVARTITEALVARRSPLALQVIGEAQNVLRRRLLQPAWQAAQNARNLLTAFDIFAATEANASESLTLMAAGQLGYWDAMLVTASRDAGCTTFLSEDMHDGARFGPLEIVNPFAGAGADARLQSLLNR
jgi:predicted nucleic acid-binding protein